MTSQESRQRPLPELHQNKRWGENSDLTANHNQKLATPAKKSPKKRRGSTRKNVSKPRNNDVLCGRGGSINSHPGNEQFRETVEKYKRVYLNARFKQEKRLIACSIVSEIRALDPPGRFLAKDPRTGLWNDIGDEKARDKTSQALRENAPALRGDVGKERANGRQNAKTIPSQNLPFNPLGMAQVCGSQSSVGSIGMVAVSRNSFAQPQMPQPTHGAGVPIGVTAVPLASYPQPPPSQTQLNPRISLGIPSVSLTTFPQQPPSQAQWQGNFNRYYAPGAYQVPPVGPFQAAQAPPQNVQRAVAPLHPPPPLPVGPCLVQNTLPQPGQHNQASQIQSTVISKSMSWSASPASPVKGEQQELNRNSNEGLHDVDTLRPDPVQGQHDGPRAAMTNEKGVSLQQSQMDISPPTEADELAAGTTQASERHFPDPCEGQKRSVSVQNQRCLQGEKRVRGDYDPTSNRYYRQAGGQLPIAVSQSPSSQEVEIQSGSGDSVNSSDNVHSSLPTEGGPASYGLNNIVVPYSPIKTETKTNPVAAQKESLKDRSTGMPIKNLNTADAKVTDDQKGSFMNTVTQHFFGTWDTDALCGGGVGDIFSSDENPLSPDRSLKRERGGEQLPSERRGSDESKAGEDETMTDGIDMEYDPTKGHRRTPSWEESFQQISPSSFRYHATPISEKHRTTRWGEPPSSSRILQGNEDPQGNVRHCHDGTLQQEDRDSLYAASIQQSETVSSEAHDAALLASINRTARSCAHDRLVATRQYGSSSPQNKGNE